MLDLRAAAKLARERDTRRLDEASGQKNPPSPSISFVQKQSDFRTRLLDSFRRSGEERLGPNPAPDALFLAFSEKLIPRWSNLAFGPLRKAKGPSLLDSGQVADLATWTKWEQIGVDTRFANFARANTKSVLIAHGLSPISDSICLLADIGRAARVARALRLPLHALLADVTWMSYNRSVRRFSLNEKEIETGLRVCLDRRRRLYEALGITHTVHSILTYQKKGMISAGKIELIAERYQELTAILWGSAYLGLDEPLTHEQVSKISRPLVNSLGPESPLHTLSRFPGTLHSLETVLKPHLAIIRAIADRFRILSIETFSYYFAQYYAQASYRANHVKICPVSERDFDEPFDELDESFRSWGEGDELAIEQTGRKPRRPHMTAIYLPHYRIGTWKVLPYSPLSLDSLVNSNGKVEEVEAHQLLISDNDSSAIAKAATLVRATKEVDFLQLNRLCADITSLLAWYIGRNGNKLVDEACKALKIESLAQVLRDLGEPVEKWFAMESEQNADWSGLWLAWLDSIESENQSAYSPTHVAIACKTAEDWDDKALDAAAQLLVIANWIGSQLSS